MSNSSQEKYYTVKELAKQFGVTEPAVRKQLKKKLYEQYSETKTIKGRPTLVLSQDGYNKLSKHFTKPISKDNNVIELLKAKDDTIKHLQEELEYTKQTLDKTHQELISSQDALNHEQELHLIEKKEFSKLKTELQETQKKLECSHNPSNENDSSNNNEETINSKLSEKNSESNVKVTKKWWQFWK